MKMKRKALNIFLLSTLLFAGCKKWLDVTPLGQSTKDQIFQSQKGFRDVLTGAYIDLKSSDIYGNAMTWSTIEYMARSWDVISPQNTTLTALVNANYTDAGARDALDKIYAKEYKVIADVNGILDNIDAKKDVFSDNNYALVKGEALALRAFAHFDVLRLFGPLPSNPGTDSVLPYVQTVSKDIVLPTTFDDFAKKVLTDLDSAESLMKGVDPIQQYSLADLNPSSTALNVPPVLSDDYYMYRQIRFNYYAVLALKARVYNWLVARNDANRVNAMKYAQMVVNGTDQKGIPTFRLGGLVDNQAGDYTFSSEHIFALSLFNMKDLAQSNFGEGGGLARYDFNVQDGFYYLNNLFPVAERTADARWVGMWVYKSTAGQSNFVRFNKFIQKDNQPILQLPLLRLSEMYLILTEGAQSKQEAESYYAAYCSKKGIPFVNGFNASDWQTDRRNKMIREYVREFYGEGQAFFTYKRYNVISLPASWTYVFYSGNAARYVVSKPDREINFHNN